VLLAEPGLFGAAEWQLVVRDLDVVDPRVPGLDQLDGFTGLRQILDYPAPGCSEGCVPLPLSTPAEANASELRLRPPEDVGCELVRQRR
jgi:hypothetical protein